MKTVRPPGTTVKPGGPRGRGCRGADSPRATAPAPRGSRHPRRLPAAALDRPGRGAHPRAGPALRLSRDRGYRGQGPLTRDQRPHNRRPRSGLIAPSAGAGRRAPARHGCRPRRRRACPPRLPDAGLARLRQAGGDRDPPLRHRQPAGEPPAARHADRPPGLAAGRATRCSPGRSWASWTGTSNGAAPSPRIARSRPPIPG